jgi:hypothetical protein
MNARRNEGNVVRIGKRILGLAGLASLALVCAGPAVAQSKPVQAESTAARPIAAAPPTSPGVGSSSATPAAKQAVAQNLPAKPSASKGQHEGIKVHGHWTIEVRNPDGKLVSHREFENSLGGYPFGNGAGLLAGILGRIVTPGSWQVTLYDPTLGNQVIINEPNSAASSECLTVVSSIQSGGRAGSCSNNLSVAGPQLTTGGISSGSLTGGTLTFTGSGTVPSGFPATIGVVDTADFVCVISDSPVTCTTDSTTLSGLFTIRSLDGNTPAGAAAGDPMPVSVSAFQTVGVTVTISFQ